MIMKKPELEIIRFESGDVIATSAQPMDYFLFSGAFDNNPNNFKMIFNGEDKTGSGNEVVTYLLNKYGPFGAIGLEFQMQPGSPSTRLEVGNTVFPEYFSRGNYVIERGNVESFNGRFDCLGMGISDIDSTKVIWFSSITN